MKLGKIKEYVRKRGESTLTDVAIHFDISKSAAKFALEYWKKKGLIRNQAAACSSSCGGCGSNSTEIYAWINREMKINWL